MRIGCGYVQDQPRLIAERAGGPVDLLAADPGLPVDTGPLLESPEMWPRVRRALPLAPPLPAHEIRWRPAVPRPAKILCVGLNYADHARETGAAIPGEPLIFNKLATTLTGHGQPIQLPRVTQQVDFEAELVVVIGQPGRDIAAADAGRHIAGYACGHDVSARDWQKQKPGGQWLLGKSFDTFAPLGPWLVTADEIPDPAELAIQLRLNGETMQQSRLDQLIFSIEFLISYISQVCTLWPGDLIFTGTPPGVGAARKPPRYLQPGDTVEVEITGLGILRNPVVAAPEAAGG